MCVTGFGEGSFFLPSTLLKVRRPITQKCAEGAGTKHVVCCWMAGLSPGKSRAWGRIVVLHARVKGGAKTILKLGEAAIEATAARKICTQYFSSPRKFSIGETREAHQFFRHFVQLRGIIKLLLLLYGFRLGSVVVVEFMVFDLDKPCR